MKKLILSLIIVLTTACFYAQSVPQGMKYQAVARDLSGNILANQQISLRIELNANVNANKLYYLETHNVNTNDFGLFSIVIGEGNTANGNFNAIPWSDDNIWMEVSIKAPNSRNFEIISNSKLLSVPYAFHAGSASKISGQENNNLKGLSDKKEGNWSLFGNTKTDSKLNKFGTLDNEDLIIVTDNKERFRYTKEGKLFAPNANFQLGKSFMVYKDSVNVTRDLHVGRNIYLNYTNNQGNPSLSETFNYGNFTVENQSKTFLSGSLKVGTEEENSVTKLNGQVTIFAEDLEGQDSDPNAYPLRVKGSNQGIAISVTREFPGWGSNFVSFFNENDKTLGRIEGGTHFAKEIIIELVQAIFDGEDGIDIDGSYYSFLVPESLRDLYYTYISGNGEFVWEYFKSTLRIVKHAGKLIINVIAAIPTYCVEDCDDVIDELYALYLAVKQQAIIVGKHLVSSTGEALISGGVSYESGGADYAEWLKKADPNEEISFGEIVGIKGGLISKKFKDASQFFAISSNPIIVGAMPEIGSEKNYEKVALMGQVPILVYGDVNLGDYILPSGKWDGTAIAINPENMKASDFSKIIGVAWSKSKNNDIFNYINTAVGFNNNHMGTMINNMQTVIDKMQKEIVKLSPEYKPLYFNSTNPDLKNPSKKIAINPIDKDDIDQIIKSSQVKSVSQTDIDEILNATEDNQQLASCYDQCSEGWTIGDVKCYVSCFIKNASNTSASQLEEYGINPNSNAIMNLIRQSKWWANQVKSKLEESMLGTFMADLNLEDFNFDPQLKDILASIKNGDFLNLNQSGALSIESLKESYENSQKRFRILTNLLNVPNN